VSAGGRELIAPARNVAGGLAAVRLGVVGVTPAVAVTSPAWWDNAPVHDSPPGADREPDYRMSLAAERTYLAYIRTALALLAGGVAVVGALPDVGYSMLRRVMGIVLVGAGLLVASTARQRWREVDAAIRRGAPLPRAHASVLIAVAVIVAGALALAFVALV
jgi:putative membrane protein